MIPPALDNKLYHSTLRRFLDTFGGSSVFESFQTTTRLMTIQSIIAPHVTNTSLLSALAPLPTSDRGASTTFTKIREVHVQATAHVLKPAFLSQGHPTPPWFLESNWGFAEVVQYFKHFNPSFTWPLNRTPTVDGSLHPPTPSRHTTNGSAQVKGRHSFSDV